MHESMALHPDLPPKVGEGDRVILFDGVCKLCNGWTRFVIRFDTDHRFKLCSMQSEEGRALLEWFGLPTDDLDTMLFVQGTLALTKSDAFLAIVGQMRFPWNLFRLAKLIPRRIRNWMYDRIARNRYRIFGRYDECLLPTPDHKQRFL